MLKKLELHSLSVASFVTLNNKSLAKLKGAASNTDPTTSSKPEPQCPG